MSALSSLRTEMPSSFGIMTSSRTRSGSSSRARWSPSSPSMAVTTSYPCALSRTRSTSTFTGSSSTTNIRVGVRKPRPSLITLGYFRFCTPPHRLSTASLSGSQGVGIETLIFRYFLRYFSSTSTEQLSRRFRRMPCVVLRDRQIRCRSKALRCLRLACLLRSDRVADGCLAARLFRYTTPHGFRVLHTLKWTKDTLGPLTRRSKAIVSYLPPTTQYRGVAASSCKPFDILYLHLFAGLDHSAAANRGLRWNCNASVDPAIAAVGAPAPDTATLSRSK